MNYIFEIEFTSDFNDTTHNNACIHPASEGQKQTADRLDFLEPQTGYDVTRGGRGLHDARHHAFLQQNANETRQLAIRGGSAGDDRTGTDRRVLPTATEGKGHRLPGVRRVACILRTSGNRHTTGSVRLAKPFW